LKRKDNYIESTKHNQAELYLSLNFENGLLKNSISSEWANIASLLDPGELLHHVSAVGLELGSLSGNLLKWTTHWVLWVHDEVADV